MGAARKRIDEPLRTLVALGPFRLPRLEQPLDVVLLRVGEVEGLEQAANLGGIVVLGGGLEALTRGQRLGQLAAKPAQETHGGRALHAANGTATAAPILARGAVSSAGRAGDF
jgi:hypothetical protein